MDIILTAGAILAGLVTLAVGMFSLASIWFDDVP
jgi:hypothetical protein